MDWAFSGSFLEACRRFAACGDEGGREGGKEGLKEREREGEKEGERGE